MIGHTCASAYGQSFKYVVLKLEQAFGICAIAMKLGKFLYYAGTVGCIGYAEPAAVGVKHLDRSLTIVDESINTERDEEFGFGCVDVLVEEFAEFAVAVVEVVRSESPEVHRYRSHWIKFLLYAVFVGEYDFSFVIIADGCTLNYRCEFFVVIGCADTASNRTIQ